MLTSRQPETIPRNEETASETEARAAMTDERMRTTRELKLCAEWLTYCLSIGWQKADLDALEEAWWKYRPDTSKGIYEQAG